MLVLCNALDALVSIGLLVTFELPVCAKAPPARLRCSLDALGLPNTRPAVEATLLPVDFFVIFCPYASNK
ncbi:MAG TPA: hypothetical protein VGC12_01190 [Methyloradius sp.]